MINRKIFCKPGHSVIKTRSQQHCVTVIGYTGSTVRAMIFVRSIFREKSRLAFLVFRTTI